jgi:MerR family mercuric resistance operon transcriptional regulator
MNENSVTIGQLARQAGIHLETVRYYERRGLLPKPPRTRSGYRIYPMSTAQRLGFIKRAQELGFSLAEISELLALRVSHKTSSAEVRSRAEAKITEIERKIRTLQSMRRSLRKLTNACAGCGPISECPIIESLEGEDA